MHFHENVFCITHPRSIRPFWIPIIPAMKTIHVVCAVLRLGDKVLAVERGYGEFKGGWEFPGGKVEPGETPEAAVKREIDEELGIAIEIEAMLGRVEHDYPSFHLSMDCFLARPLGKPAYREAEDHRFLAVEELGEVDFLPADRKVLPLIAAALGGSAK